MLLTLLVAVAVLNHDGVDGCWPSSSPNSPDTTTPTSATTSTPATTTTTGTTVPPAVASSCGHTKYYYNTNVPGSGIVGGSIVNVSQ